MRIYAAGSRGWNLKQFATSCVRVPGAKGVYVLSELQTFEGLPISLNPVYVGKSKHLRRRLSEHTLQSEKNSALESYLRQRPVDLWVWYTTDLRDCSLVGLEKILISRLSPRFNTHHNNPQLEKRSIDDQRRS